MTAPKRPAQNKLVMNGTIAIRLKQSQLGAQFLYVINPFLVNDCRCDFDREFDCQVICVNFPAEFVKDVQHFR
jgi:hypothetical protein